jgi:hypothetical protein
LSKIENNKWEGCPYDVKKHEEALKRIALGFMPDPFGRGFKYHNAQVGMAYEWLKEKKAADMAKGIYY